MFDPMPQPRRTLVSYAEYDKVVAQMQRRTRIRNVILFVVSVVSIALVAAFILQYMEVLCNV